MDIKEIGVGAVIVIGGVAYGVSSGGLMDALSSDVKQVEDVSYEERADYMNEIVSEFSETFEVYIVQTNSYDYVGNSKFSASPRTTTFVEVVTSQQPVPRGEFGKIKAQTQASFCEQGEMKMFTEKGWSYKFTLNDDKRGRIFTTVCSPDAATPSAKNKVVS